MKDKEKIQETTPIHLQGSEVGSNFKKKAESLHI